MNGLPLLVDTRSAYSYADDFKVISQNLEEAQSFKSEIEKWSKDNHLKLNRDKGKSLCIKGKHVLQSDVNDQIQNVNFAKDLESIISGKLS